MKHPRPKITRFSYLSLETAAIFTLIMLSTCFGILGYREYLLPLIFALSILALRLLQGKSKRPLPVPFVPIFALLVSGATAYIYYPALQHDALVSMDIPYDPVEYRTALLLFLLAAFSLWAGAIAVIRPIKQPPTLRNWQSELARRWSPLILVASLAPVCLVLLGFGVTGLLERRHYLHISGYSGAVSLSLLALPIGTALIAFILFNKGTSVVLRLSAAVVLGVYILAYIGTGSRGLGLVPIILLIVAFSVYRPSPVVRALMIIVATIIAVWGVSFPLQIRLGANGAGIIPTLQYIVGEDMYWGIKPGQVFGNILFGLPLTGQIAGSDELPAYGFWTSISPLPSRVTRWNELQPMVSWGPATPYNALGELADYGMFQMIAYLLVVGAILGVIDNAVAGYSSPLRDLVYLSAFSTAAMFSTGLFQYPLRNSSRYIWYLVIMLLAVSMVIAFFQGIRTRPHFRPPKSSDNYL